MDGGRFHKISCIFGDIDRMTTTNAHFERSRAVLEKHNLVLPLNFVGSGVQSVRKLLMVNVSREDGWRAVSQDQMHLWRYLLKGNNKYRLRKITSSY